MARSMRRSRSGRPQRGNGSGVSMRRTYTSALGSSEPMSGVLGEREPHPERIGNEVGLLMVTLARTQEIAYAIAGQAAHMVLHHAVPQWEGLLSNLAFPIAPHFWNLGEAYKFVLNHVVELDDPLELHPIRYEDI
jgi:hypothetical protein